MGNMWGVGQLDQYTDHPVLPHNSVNSPLIYRELPVYYEEKSTGMTVYIAM